MALSPNYGWSEPDNSSLVKNGAADIRTLGDSIDTSVWNVGFGQAAKNKIINGDFSVNQRNFTSTTLPEYGFDRWIYGQSGSTGTYSAQTFTLGAAPVAGYEGTNFARLAITTGNDFARLINRIESVRTFAGQTATLSFWAKGTNPTTLGRLNVRLQQFFGSGGSPSSAVDTAEQNLVLTANWTRYSFTFNVPSISGKTLGTDNSNYLAVDIGQLSNTSSESWTLDLWGVQLEYGSKATPFQTASGGSRQAELAMCQRYYYRESTGAAYGSRGFGIATSTTNLSTLFNLPVQMRVTPTSIEYANLSVQLPGTGAYAVSAIAIDTGVATKNTLCVNATTSGVTKNQTYYLANDNNVNGYLGASAEL
jgi:hypothetical protein